MLLGLHLPLREVRAGLTSWLWHLCDSLPRLLSPWLGC